MFPTFKYKGFKSIDNFDNQLELTCEKDSKLNSQLKQKNKGFKFFKLDNIIIKFPFIFGVVHYDIANSLNIPLIATLI